MIVPATVLETIEPVAVHDTHIVDDSEATAKAFIYHHESGNTTHAINPSSGACGLGQALPCSKMPCTLYDYECQDAFFTDYMITKYGTWANAVAFWNCIGTCTNNYATVTKTATWW